MKLETLKKNTKKPINKALKTIHKLMAKELKLLQEQLKLIEPSPLYNSKIDAIKTRIDFLENQLCIH